MAAAIIFEVCGTTSMKLSDGYTRLLPSIAVFVFYFFSFSSLGLALKILDVSVAYAIWSGVGTAAIAIIGTVWFREDLTASKVLWLAMIIVGVVGLNLSTNKLEHSNNPTEDVTPTPP